MANAEKVGGEATIRLLLQRRSVAAAKLAGPGPDEETLATILKAAARVPDHKRLVPWRFIVFEGAARLRFGEMLCRVLAARSGEALGEERLGLERGRLTRAPLVVAVVTRVVENPAVPEWEQVLSAGACCQNLVIAANAFGFSTNWITEWYAFDADVARELGLGAGERIAGFIHIGTATEPPVERERPDLAAITMRW
ncbi:MAG: nitroreductase [Hyphomicrobiaceae bacterium]